ncbi:MAG: hypothetical protein ABSF61_03020 [Anaerolineales bacterium]
MSKKAERHSYGGWVSLTLAVFSVLLLGMALWPPSILSESIPLVDEPLASARAPSSVDSNVDFALSLHWPTGLRLGQTATARLTLAPVKGQIPTPTPGFNRMVVAELRGNGIVVDPEGEIAEPLSPAGRANFAWTIKTASKGSASATMFLRLRLVPQGGGEAVERTVWARPLQTRVLAPLGLSRAAEFALGVATLIVSGVLMLPRILGKFGR